MSESAPAVVESRPRRRLRASVALVVALIAFGLLIQIGYLTKTNTRCAFSAVDKPAYRGAHFVGHTRWQWWPIGWRTECRAFAPDGRELPYVPQDN